MDRSLVRPRRLPIVAGTAAVALLAAGLFAGPRAGSAMPQFAQATGLQCSACHTMVPLLNAYGRYVQRTGYAAIEREQLNKTFPVWVSEGVNYDSTAGAGTGTARFDAGNLGVHAVGYAAPDVTYHVQQWLVQGSASGGLDTFWAAENHVLGPDVHLFVGKVESVGPSPYSQTFEIDGPTASNRVIGEHDWSATNDNRWGMRVNVVRPGIDVAVGYLASGEDLNGATAFGPGDRTFQWKAAFATPKSPLEFGLFGSAGTIPVSTGTDRYSSVAGYVQLDPGKDGRPGLFAVYQRGYDTNPGTAPDGVTLYPATTSRGASAGIYEPFLRNNLVLGLRHDFSDTGATGGIANGNAINVGFVVPGTASYVHGYLEANLGANSALVGASNGPTWKGMLWLTLPVRAAH